MRSPRTCSAASAMAPLALPQPNRRTRDGHGRSPMKMWSPSRRRTRVTSGLTSPAASAARQMAWAASRADSDKRAELLQALSRFPEHVVGLREAEPDLRAAEVGVRIERRAGHGGHPDLLDEVHRERVVVLDCGGFHEARHVGEDVVGAARLPRDEASALDVTPQQVATRLIGVA